MSQVEQALHFFVDAAPHFADVSHDGKSELEPLNSVSAALAKATNESKSLVIFLAANGYAHQIAQVTLPNCNVRFETYSLPGWEQQSVIIDWHDAIQLQPLSDEQYRFDVLLKGEIHKEIRLQADRLFTVNSELNYLIASDSADYPITISAQHSLGSSLFGVFNHANVANKLTIAFLEVATLAISPEMVQVKGKSVNETTSYFDAQAIAKSPLVISVNALKSSENSAPLLPPVLNGSFVSMMSETQLHTYQL